MRSALTLVNIYAQDAEKVGHRAVDLARIAQARYPVPLCFVIPCELFDEFLEQSGIRSHARSIFARHPQTIDGYARAYKELNALFQQVSFSQELKEELLEAYASLAIPSKDSGATALVGSEDEPAVTLIPSPTYLLWPERLDGMLQNIRGGSEFLDAIKECWCSAYLPELVLERQQFMVDTFSMGVIVQQQLSSDSAEGFYHASSEHPLQVHGYFGMLDTRGEVTKDEHIIAREHLRVEKSVVKQQPFQLYPEEQSGVIGQSYLQERGAKQVLSERQALEVARLVKRVHILLEQDLHVYCSVKDERVTILFALREKPSPITQVVEASPAPAPVVEDEYVPVEEAFIPQELDEQARVEIVDAEPVIAEVPLSEAEHEEASPAVEVYDEEPVVVSSEESEETLFDLFPQEAKRTIDAPSSRPLGAASFIDEVVAEVEEVIERLYVELNGRHSHDLQEMVASLVDAGLLPVPKDDLDALLVAHGRVQELLDAEDAEIGLAWRVQAMLRARER